MIYLIGAFIALLVIIFIIIKVMVDTASEHEERIKEEEAYA